MYLYSKISFRKFKTQNLICRNFRETMVFPYFTGPSLLEVSIVSGTFFAHITLHRGGGRHPGRKKNRRWKNLPSGSEFHLCVAPE